MYRRFKDRFGTAGVIIAVIALVAALGGGAYAATGGLTGKQKKQVTKIAKKFAGKPGPAGPQGPQGVPGAPGKDGANGKDGAQGLQGESGEDGTSVTSSTEPTSTLNCGGRGGSKFAAGASTTYACNGEKGEEGDEGPVGNPWTAGGTLPVNATETGTFEQTGITGVPREAISFPIPLAAPLSPGHVHFQGDLAFADTCTGSAANPTAPSGEMCIYVGHKQTTGLLSIYSPDKPSAQIPFDGRESGTTGAILYLQSEGGNVTIWGTYAVTG